jgi:K+-sensing histidine kinase KdpD
MSKVIVEEHLNGMLTAKNNEEGATFTIALPQQHGGEANH